MLAHSSAHRLAFLGTILPGMRRDLVLRLLKKRLPPPEVRHDDFWTGPAKSVLGWDMPGKADYNAYGQPRFTDWTAALMFDNGTLEDIEVECG